MTSILGIDLGTTYSVVAVMAEDGPRILPNSLGEPLTPSVVGLDHKGCVLVGQEAREWSVLHPERCAAVFKRHMGSDHKLKLAGRTFSPEELSSLVLRRLKEDAEAHLGRKVDRAVITVPAYFNDRQRTATLQAGEIAGFKVERIFNEPTAAALAYGFHEARAEKVLLIFDLGGGTFDVSLVESFEGILEVKASAGEIFLGGEDFTRSLAGHVLRQVGLSFEKAELEHPLLVARLLRQCEIAKCRLTVRERVLVRLPDARGELDETSREVEVTRADFEQATGRILARVEGPVRRVLGDAGLRREDVHEVILVGGATRMPAVVDLVQRSFGKKPQCRLDPDQVVALGAAVQAGLIERHAGVEDLVVTDVAPFTLGIEISKVFDTAIQDGYFLPVIHRNATIPISRVEPVCTLHANQTEIRVRIFQGDNRKTDQNLFLGEFVVSGIPPGPPGRPIDVRFTYDLNGILEVEATVLETKRSFNHVVTRFARGLSRDQIARAVRDLARLKMHPREDSRNRLLLARSERLFRELPRILRDELGLLLDAFEAALASQDLGRIEQERAPLEMFLSRCDPGTDDDGEEFAHDG